MKSDVYRAGRTFLRGSRSVVGCYDIPCITKQDVGSLGEVNLVGFHNIRVGGRGPDGRIVHFFMDDYKFERVWYYPEKYVKRLNQYRAVCTPDFSIYRNMPISMQLFNIFRRQWCGAFWQSCGITVIPTVTWGDEKSFAFCFDGIEKHGTVIISTIGSRKIKDQYLAGYERMLEAIDPSRILCYGKPFSEMHGRVTEIPYAASNALTAHQTREA